MRNRCVENLESLLRSQFCAHLGSIIYHTDRAFEMQIQGHDLFKTTTDARGVYAATNMIYYRDKIMLE